MYNGDEFKLFDFSKGLGSATFSTALDPSLANYLSNITIRVGGGIEKRRGNIVFNPSAMGSGAAVTGLEAIKYSSGTEYLVATASNKIYQGITSGSTMTDITGSVTITSSANNIWTISMLNDLAIGVGGAPDAPWKWSGTGNAAALGGSPPSGSFGFQHNNRMFIGGITGNLSRLQWSVLGNPEDWTSTGAGSQDIWKNDGDDLVGYAILADDLVLLFKQRSIHRMIGHSAPFPVFPIFRDIGAIGKKAIVVVNGIAYFITPRARMVVTDGNQIFSDQALPNLRNIDDLWNGLNQSRLKFIEGRRYTGLGFDHIYWLCSNTGSSTNNIAFIWDLKNQCWLQHTTGHSGNVLTKTQNGTLYMGSYDGKIYQMDVNNTYTDASETAPGAIDGYWRSGWLPLDTILQTKHPRSIRPVLVSQTSGMLTVGYGFDYVNDNYTQQKNMQAAGGVWDQSLWDQAFWGGQTDLIRTVFTIGRGNVFEFSFRNNNPNEVFQLHGVSISGKKSSQKVLEAP